MNKKHFETNNEWETWLALNHLKEKELWLVYYKKHTNRACVSYEESVQTALCYGWIDGLVKRIDDACYARRFTPRKVNSVWSESNKKRVAELLREDKMQPAGIKLVEAAKKNGNWDKVISPPEIDLSIPDDFLSVLNSQPSARNYFETLSKRHKKEYLLWINTAKRTETREKRMKEAVEMLIKNQTLGLK